MIKKTIGEKLKAAREAKGLSQMDVAQKTGMSYMAYFMIEKGVTKNPKQENVTKLQELLGVRLINLRNKKEKDVNHD